MCVCTFELLNPPFQNIFPPPALRVDDDDDGDVVVVEWYHSIFCEIIGSITIHCDDVFVRSMKAQKMLYDIACSSVFSSIERKKKYFFPIARHCRLAGWLAA